MLVSCLKNIMPFHLLLSQRDVCANTYHDFLRPEFVPMEIPEQQKKYDSILHTTVPRRAIWEVVRLGEFITRNQFFAYKCYVCWILKPIFALSYSQILRWSYAGAIIVIQVQEKTACHCLKKSLALLPNVKCRLCYDLWGVLQIASRWQPIKKIAKNFFILLVDVDVDQVKTHT